MRHFAPVIVVIFLITLVTTACVVRTRPAHRHQTIQVRDDHDHGKHKKQKKQKKQKHDD